MSGSIDVGRYDENIVPGRFNSKLGRWTPGQSPQEDPPSETVEVRNGIFTHFGIRQ